VVCVGFVLDRVATGRVPRGTLPFSPSTYLSPNAPYSSAIRSCSNWRNWRLNMKELGLDSFIQQNYESYKKDSFIHQRLYISLLGPGLFSFVIYFTQMVGLLGREISPSQGRYLCTGQLKHRINAYTDIHALSGIRTEDPSIRASEGSSCPRPRGHCDRLIRKILEEFCEFIESLPTFRKNLLHASSALSILLPWILRQHYPPKRCCLSTATQS
jgi:hypothetical protein